MRVALFLGVGAVLVAALTALAVAAWVRFFHRETR